MTKTIYLDQNKWIDIARAFYGRNDGKPFLLVLDVITKKVKNEEIILPMSMIHYIETSRAGDKGRRERLARFMVELSKGYGILPFPSVREIEVQQAIARKLGISPATKIRDIVIGKGLSFILGSDIVIESESPEIIKKLTSILGEDETLIKLLVDAMDRDTAKSFVKDNNQVLAQLEESRRLQGEKLSSEMRLRLAIADMANNSLIPIAIRHLSKVGLDPKKFADQMNTAEDWKTFFLDIPTMDIWINLNVLRDNDLSRAIHKNDTYDIAFLAIAIPYCDIVVVEKYWAHQLITKGFDKKYNCVVLTDLKKLSEHL